MNNSLTHDLIITRPKIGIVILTYNRIDVLEMCLQSILKSKYQDIIIIVIDNASSDRTSIIIKEKYPMVILIKNEINLGYTGGNNVGIKYAIENKNCEYVLILNDDTIIDQNLLNILVTIAEKDPNIGVINPEILSFEIPTISLMKYGKYNFYLGIEYQKLSHKLPYQEIDLLRGTCFLIKKEVIQKIGLMDEDYFLYFDEADLSFRIRKTEFKIVYAPTAKVYHQISKSFSGMVNPIVLYYSTRNELLFAKKHLNLFIFYPLWIPRFFLRIISYLLKTRKIEVIKFIVKGMMDFKNNQFGKLNT